MANGEWEEQGTDDSPHPASYSPFAIRHSPLSLRLGLRMIRAQERIRAVAADRGAAEALQIAEGTPLLSVERVTYTYGERPVEWRRGLYSTTEHYYLNELN